MPVAASNRLYLEQRDGGGWWFEPWSSRRVVAGLTDRYIEPLQLLSGLRASETTVEAEQVHGGSIAIVGQLRDSHYVVPGCDALLTEIPGVALLIRTADCLPMIITDLSRGAVGIAHAGWRGLAAQLPVRVVAAFRHAYHSRADELHVAIGPSIRACCYEVGPEFTASFGRFVHEQDGRRTCDLIGVAVDQLRESGIRPDRIVDSGRCTACGPQHWFSVRREGDATGRLTSFVMLRR